MDANALLYLRARYYNPALGVFTALDPIENPNRYQYVSANPINRVDPSGQFDWCSGKIEAGDWLWNISRQGSSPDATSGEILAGVYRLIEANRYHPNYNDMRSNPDLIQPYSRWDPLVVPEEMKAWGEVNNRITCSQGQPPIPASECGSPVPPTPPIPTLSESCLLISISMGTKVNPSDSWLECFRSCERSYREIHLNAGEMPSLTNCEMLTCRTTCDNFDPSLWLEWLSVDISCEFTNTDKANIVLNGLGLIPGLGLAASAANCAIQVGGLTYELIKQGFPKVTIEQTMYDISVGITPSNINISAEDAVGPLSSCLNALYNAAGKAIPGVGEAWAFVDSMYTVYQACNR